MKHKLLTTIGVCLALGCVTVNLNAQTEVKKSAKVLYLDDEMCFGGDFHAISPNGKYAVGFSPEHTRCAYLFNFETNELTWLKEGAAEDVAEANAVSDNGIVAGNFLDADSPSSKGKPTLVPGYWKDGKWTRLPRVPEVPNAGSGMNGSATAISADGKIICGHIQRIIGVNVEVIWVDGVLQPVSEEELLGQGNIPICFSQEGKLIGGYASHEDGSRSPAIWEEGVMTRLEGLKSASQIHEETGENVGFFDGHVRCFTDDGKFAVGYFDPSGDGFECKPFIWSKEKGLEYFAESGAANIITKDKTIYGIGGYMGTAFIYKDGIMTDLEEYLKNEYNFVPDENFIPMGTPTGVSADGKIIVGWALTVVESMPVMKPMAIMLEENEIKPGSIESANNENLTIVSSVIANELQINGQYTSAKVYNSVGATILNDHQLNGTISFEGQSNGVYFVKVSNGSQTQTFKVVKK